MKSIVTHTATQPTVESLTDYYPFGMAMPGRSYNATDYRFGYTGHEKEGDLAEGVYTTQYRLLDTRLGRWMSVDPLFGKYADMGAYNYCGGNPVGCWDPDGREIRIPTGNGSYISYTPGVTKISDINDSFGKSVITALDYLYSNGSSNVKTTIERLSEPDCFYHIEITYHSSDTNADDICGMPYKQYGRVEWNMMGMELRDGTILSPAVCLYHELGHVDLFLQSILVDQQLNELNKKPIKNKKNIDELNEVDYGNRAYGVEPGWAPGEYAVNRDYETDAAVSLGEYTPSDEHPYTRDSYKDYKRGSVKTINVISTIEEARNE